MIVNGVPFTRTPLPIASGAAFSRDDQNACETTITGCPPGGGCPAPARNSPRAGGSPPRRRGGGRGDPAPGRGAAGCPGRTAKVAVEAVRALLGLGRVTPRRPDRDQPIRSSDAWHRTKDDRVHRAEDRGHGAAAERDDEDDRHAEDRALAQHPAGEAQVVGNHLRQKRECGRIVPCIAGSRVREFAGSRARRFAALRNHITGANPSGWLPLVRTACRPCAPPNPRPREPRPREPPVYKVLIRISLY